MKLYIQLVKNFIFYYFHKGTTILQQLHQYTIQNNTEKIHENRVVGKEKLEIS